MDQNVYMDGENYINVLEEFSFGVDIIASTPPCLSRANDPLPVLMTSLRFRHVISGSLLFVSISLT